MLLMTVFALAGVSVMFLVLYHSSLSRHHIESKLLIEKLIFYLRLHHFYSYSERFWCWSNFNFCCAKAQNQSTRKTRFLSFLLCVLHSEKILTSERAPSLLFTEFLFHSSSVMKRRRLLTVVAAAAFFVALTSLYRMLDVMHRQELEHKQAGLPGHVEEVRRLQLFTWKCQQCSLKTKHPITCHNVVFPQDLSHLHQKIEKLEHLLGDNNRLVIRLHDTLDQQKILLRGGEKANQSVVEAPPICQLTKEVNNGSDGVQVSSCNYVCNTVWLYWWLMLKHLFHWLCSNQWSL